jgi:hypothetical protein
MWKSLWKVWAKRPLKLWRDVGFGGRQGPPGQNPAASEVFDTSSSLDPGRPCDRGSEAARERRVHLEGV